MDDELTEDIVVKNQYHLDDDDFLSAPCGLLKDDSATQDSSEAPPEYSPHPIDKNIHLSKEPHEQKTSPNHTKPKKRQISYGVSDDTSDSSDADDIASTARRYTQQSQPSQEALDSTKSNNKSIGKQYSILLNDKSFLSQPDANYPNNYIKTSKYTLLTFIPLNLFEQFRRIANIYFLIIIGIQLIPGVSPFPIGTSIMPLAFILCVGAIKDGIEDYDRHKQDRIANSMVISRLNHHGQFAKCSSAELQASDIILIQRNQQIPADCIVLSCDHSNGDNSGVCYINTSSMDGENAPKLRRAVQSTHNIRNHQQLCKLKGYVKCPPNTKALHGFTGALSIKKSTIPQHKKAEETTPEQEAVVIAKKTTEKTKLSTKEDSNYGTIGDEEEDASDDDVYLAAQVNKNENKLSVKQRQSELEGDFISGLSDTNFIFRGSKLVNADFIYALVLFVGRETKLMLNRNSVPFKFSKFEKILNMMILSILMFNFVLCVAFGIAANVVSEPYPELERDSWFHGFALDTCSWLILTSWMIPFSLYVTLELVKMMQAQWVAWDEKMTYNPDNIHIANGGSTKNGSELNRPRPDSISLDSVRLEKKESVVMDHSWDEEYGAIRHAKTKNSNLNEELGHIDYIFTDKTGTLTQNLMELSKCSVGGIKYQNDAPNNYIHPSNDFDSFSSLIHKMCDYERKKYQLFKLHKKKYHKHSNNTLHNSQELMNMINNDLNQQFQHSHTNTSNKNISPLTQFQHDTHFVFNLLLCSATVPAKTTDHNIDLDTESPVVTPPSLNLGHQKLVQSNSKDVHNTEEKLAERTKIEYQSPSPDEVAFAEALYDHGIVLEERQADGTIVIHLKPAKQRLKFKILATLDFTARRKRMSVIVLDEMGEIHLYCKGADSTLFRLCGGGNDGGNGKSLIHVTKRHVTNFARDGSRTLVIGYKKLSMAEYEEFDVKYREAEVALNRRQELIEDAFSYCEHSLSLLGCTAVEDQMQDGVPEAICKLKEAKIKVIMLTGDKQETAVSIGRQSLMIDSNMLDSDLMYLVGRRPPNLKDIAGLEKQMRRIDKKVSNFMAQIEEQHSGDRDNALRVWPALILNGDALEMCLSSQSILEKFVVLFSYCSTIICNRCAPSQKAMLVWMAKNKLDGVALAIGDGANDVSMIQASNVGVGLMGKEGTQASLAADFVIHRFKHLIRLLFVHGRYAFLRTAQVSLLSLYKNMAFMLTICYYGAYSLYTAQSCFDPYLMSAFNLLFVALFPLVVGAFEQDINAKTCLWHPAAYYFFKSNSFFTIKYFLFWMFTAAWQSLVWFSIAILVYNDNLDLWQSGGHSKNGGLYVFGTQIFTTNVIVICAKMMMETYHWNWTYYASTMGGIAIYIIALAVLSNWLYLDSDMFNVMQFTLNCSMTWLILIIQCVLCLFPGILYNLWKRERFANLSTVLYEAQKFGYLTKNGIPRATNDIIEDYLTR